MSHPNTAVKLGACAHGSILPGRAQFPAQNFQEKYNPLSSKIFDNELQRSWKHTKGNQLKENVERLFLNRYSFDLLFFSFIKKVVDCYKTVADWFVKLFRSKARPPLRTNSCLNVRTCKAFDR